MWENAQNIIFGLYEPSIRSAGGAILVIQTFGSYIHTPGKAQKETDRETSSTLLRRVTGRDFCLLHLLFSIFQVSPECVLLS